MALPHNPARTVARNPSVIIAGGQPISQFPFVEWGKLKNAITWNQGGHFLAVGGTGSGKSTVAGEFLPKRKRVVVCVSKGMDDIFSGPYYRDYEIHQRWPLPRKWFKYHDEEDPRKVLLWPPNIGEDIDATQKSKTVVFRRMFGNVLLKVGNWCVVIDEEHYMSETLKLYREITDMLEQGRSAGISMWNNTQRPSGIPLATYVNSIGGFFFTSQEEYDVRRLGNMRNKHTHPKEMMANIERLESFDTHEHVFMDRTGRIPPVRSIVDIRKR